MAYVSESPEVKECFAELSALGALVDVYSSEWLTAHPDFPDFNTADLEEYQSRSHNMCEGHLLIISTSLDDQAVSTLLPAAYPSLRDVLDPEIRNHKPDLIFLNLATKQILWVGLGRKNQLFGFAVGAEDVKLRDGNIEDVIRPSSDVESADPTFLYMREFLKYDYSGIVSDLIESLYEFGVCARAVDHLPLNPDLIGEILDEGPDGDGLYDIDDELLTLEEVQAVLAEFEEAENLGHEHLQTLQQFFPDISWSDLNTQDY
jgi:hypothetical protein